MVFWYSKAMPARTKTSPTIKFQSIPYRLGEWLIVRLPESASKQLPSRGQVIVKGTLNDVNFESPLEPDGKFSHWFHIPEQLAEDAGLVEGVAAGIELNVSKDWPEPEIPQDFLNTIHSSDKASSLWLQITPMARWEWLRWTRSTNNSETRQRRLRVAISKMEAGERRPCCWNRNLCTEPSVSKNGVLLDPS